MKERIKAMTDAIEAYNERLEAMAAACEFDYALAGFENRHQLRMAAAFIRSQMPKPIEEAPKHMNIIIAVGDQVEIGWKSADGAINLPARIRDEPTHFLPLPQIGDGNDMGRG